MNIYVKGKLIEGVTQVEMLKSGVVSVITISRDDEGRHLTDEASLLLDVNHYPIKDVAFGEGMVTEHRTGEPKKMKTCNDAPVGYTDHPPVGGWQRWNGGMCPVHPLATVDYIMAKGDRCKDEAVQLTWTHEGDDWDIIAYRIVEEYKAPVEKKALEVWLVKSPTGNNWYQSKVQYDDCVLFREVAQ